MNLYEMEDQEDIAEAIIRSLEQDADKKVFTIRFLNNLDDGLETLIVFEDRTVLLGMVTVKEIKGKLACRIRGNYI